MKRILLTLSVILGFFAVISCSNASDSSNDFTSGLPGTKTLKKQIPEMEDLDKNETWTELETDNISVLIGTWKMQNIQGHLGNVSYTELYTVTFTISELSDTYYKKDTYRYDYSAAVSEAGEDLWTDIKESGAIYPIYTIDNNTYSAAWTTKPEEEVSSIASEFGNSWFNIEDNTSKFYFNSNYSKFKIYDPETQQLKIYIKQ